MSNQFDFSVPAVGGGAAVSFTLHVGEILYLLGANGAGKSGLVTRLFNQHQANSKRISAHRQTWFESNFVDITARGRDDLDRNVRAHDGQAQARYREWNASGRANMTIFDLINADTMQARKVRDLLQAGDEAGAKKEADTPSPIQTINEMMRLSNLPIEVIVQDAQEVLARKNGGAPYSVAELSDGERNAFLIAAAVLTAQAGTLILIDEPERHLHRSIISPLLKLLFDKRSDCAFIVSTHEIMLPVDTPKAATLLVRGCEYQGKEPVAWTLDMLPPGTSIDEELKRDLLGARRKMIFVEGTTQSLDAPLYSLLFPGVSVIPKDACHDVEHAVRGLRGASDVHWIEAWGIVDNDQRSADDVRRLHDAGIWALSHYSVESYYYHPKIVARIAARKAQLTGADADALTTAALGGAVAATKSKRDHLVTSAVVRSARSKVFDNLPTRARIEGKSLLDLQVDLAALRTEEEKRFDSLVAAADWDGLLTRYPLRQSSAFDQVVKGLQMTDQKDYRAAVLKLLQDSPDAVADLRALFGDLYATVTG